MHVLDLIMYIVLAILLWCIIDKVSGGEFTNELGTIGGIFFEFIFLIVYIIVFVVLDNNWVDIFSSLKDITWPNITW